MNSNALMELRKVKDFQSVQTFSCREGRSDGFQALYMLECIPVASAVNII